MRRIGELSHPLKIFRVKDMSKGKVTILSPKQARKGYKFILMALQLLVYYANI
jgi:hypothetical protein